MGTTLKLISAVCLLLASQAGQADTAPAAPAAPATSPGLPSTHQLPPPIDGIDVNDLIKRTLPLTPDQIRTLRRALDATQKAASDAPSTPPRPVTASLSASQSPGATPPIVRLSSGFVSSLVFLDATGAPWPVSSYVNGNPTATEVSMPDKKGNVITVSALSGYIHGNIAVNLQDNPTPVVITLVSGQKEVDYRADIRVLSRGPNATAVFGGESSTSLANPMLLSALDGVTPTGASPISISGGDIQAWGAGGRVYLRTRMPLLSPAWISSMVSADGMRAYEIQYAPVILVSNSGTPQSVKLGSFRIDPTF